MRAPRFRPGDRVVHITSSLIPEGARGTVLGEADAWHKAIGYDWEVEYDEHPCPRASGVGARSGTSWYSRDSSIELTREAALARAREAP